MNLYVSIYGMLDALTTYVARRVAKALVKRALIEVLVAQAVESASVI